MSEMTLRELHNEMMDFLPKYQYDDGAYYRPTDYGIDKIIERWEEKKHTGIGAILSRHPNYNGRFQIVLDETFNREIDRLAIREFRLWLRSKIEDDCNVPIRAFVRPPEDRDYYPCGWVKRESYMNDWEVTMDDFVGRTVNVVSDYGNGRVSLVLHKGDYSNVFNFEKDHLLLIYEGNSFTPPNGDSFTESKYRFIRDLLKDVGQYLDDDETEKLNNAFPWLKLHRNGKTSRVIRRICQHYGIANDPEFNERFTKFADAINPLKVQRWTIISWHPIDYWAMSFGNSWTSCHSIDKVDALGVYSGSYHGCYSGGTESYMLDSSSVVMYVVDRSFNGERFELEPKILRQMFHIDAEGRRFVQGRLYPQDNDSGAKETYDAFRQIMQHVIAECFGLNNDWVVKHGTQYTRYAIDSDGEHYRDYECYDNCTLSTLRSETENDLPCIQVGSVQICPTCGRQFFESEFIVCEDCRDVVTCEYCGETVCREDAIVTEDGSTFCCVSCAENEDYVYCENVDGWYHRYRDHVLYDDRTEEYFYNSWYENPVFTEDGMTFRTEEIAEEAGYVYCDGDGWYSVDDCVQNEEGEWIHG